MSTIRSLLCVSIASLIASTGVRGQDDSLSARFEVRRAGPFKIGKDPGKMVFAQITRVHLTSTRAIDWPESDVSFALLDSAGSTLVRSNYPAEGTDELNVACVPMKVNGIGDVLALYHSYDPSAPGSGVDLKILGLDRLGNIIPLTGTINAQNTALVYLDPATGQRWTTADAEVPGAEPYIESEEWTGNFTALVYYHIRKTGVSFEGRALSLGMEKIPVRIDPEEARQNRTRFGEAKDSVMLCPSPNADAKPARAVPIRRDSVIEFLNAARTDDWWLHVIIDGTHGYIAREHFPALGLPDAG